MLSILIVVVAATACTDPDPEPTGPVSLLRAPGDPTAAAGAILPDVPEGGVRSLGVGTLCVTGKPVLVTGVEPISAEGGLAVAGWGVRPSAFQAGQEGFGEFDGSIPADEGFVVDDGARVSGRCPATAAADAEERLTELAVGFRSGAQSSSPDGGPAGVVHGGREVRDGDRQLQRHVVPQPERRVRLRGRRFFVTGAATAGRSCVWGVRAS